jgi:16S rRNA (adenine1518-N6/adenine1519-N6)-dimethyltransferase
MEKDDHLFDLLQGRYQDQAKLRIVHEDILECDLPRLIQDNMKIVSNLPYNIATQLIMRLAEHAQRISCVVVMLQKEVAQRICARAGDKEYSALSLIVQAGFDAEPGFIVSPQNFFPRPKVDSQVVKLVPAASPIPLEDREIFRKVVWAAFHQRRKVLRNTLLQLPRMDSMLLETIAQRCGINLRSRPQEITAGQYHLFSQVYRQSINYTQT